MGGGGDGGASKRQDQADLAKTRARSSLNTLFGVSAAPSKDQYQWGSGWGPQDQARFEAAQREYDQGAAERDKNATGREDLYDKIRTDAFTAGKRNFDDRRENAERDLKFTLFAQGLNGGSVDVDQNALLGRTYDRGLLDLGGKADAVRAGFKAGDEDARLGLLQSIDAGMDQNSALSSALNQMKINAEKSAAEAQGVNIGDLFADAGLLYTKSNAARGKRDAEEALFAAYPRLRSYVGSSGIITPTN